MRLHKITANIATADNDTAAIHIKYVGTQAEAAATRKAYMALGATRKDIESVEVDVPTDKAGLMAFLNGMAKS